MIGKEVTVSRVGVGTFIGECVTYHGTGITIRSHSDGLWTYRFFPWSMVVDVTWKEIVRREEP